METKITKVYDVQLDLKKASTNPRMVVIGGDTSNFFRIRLTDDGEPVDLTGSRIIAIFTAEDNLAAQDSAEEDSGIVIAENYVNEIMLEVFVGSYSYDGLTQCDLQIYSGDDYATLATTAKFSFRASRPLLNDESIKTRREFPILTGLISQVEGLRDDYEGLIKGNGDMMKELYDTNDNGVVDDAERLGGELPEHYASKSFVAEATSSLTPEDVGAAPEVHTHTPEQASAVPVAEKGSANGIPTLDANKRVSAEQTSSYVTDVTASKTLSLEDAGKCLRVNSASAITITIPTDGAVSFPVGTEIEFIRWSTGTVTISPASGTNLFSIDNVRTISDRYGIVSVKKVSENNWILAGALG